MVAHAIDTQVTNDPKEQETPAIATIESLQPLDLGSHLQSVIDGKIEQDEFAKSTSDHYAALATTAKRREFLYRMADWLAAMDDCMTTDVEQRRRFLDLVKLVIKKGIIPEALVKEVLDIATLEDAQLVQNKVWRVEISRMRTTRVYTQQVYSLAVEDVEGFAALTTYLIGTLHAGNLPHRSDGQTLVSQKADTVIEGVRSIATRHKLAQFRVVASILHMSSVVIEYGWAVLLEMAKSLRKVDMEDALIFLFKQSFMRSDIQDSKRLSFVSALLALHEFLDFRRLYYQLWSDVQKMQFLQACASIGATHFLTGEFRDCFRQDSELARLRCRLILASTQTVYQGLKDYHKFATSKMQESKSTGEIQAPLKPAKQDETNASNASLASSAISNAPVTKTAPSRARINPTLVPDDNFFYEEWESHIRSYSSTDDFLQRIRYDLHMVGINGLASYPVLASRLARMAAISLRILAKSPDAAKDLGGGKDVWLSLLVEFVVPAIGIHEPEGGGFLNKYPEQGMKESWNAALCDDLWLALRELDFRQRLRFYTKWHEVAISDSDPDIVSAKKQTIEDTGKAMRRLAKETVNLQGRNICRNAARFPTLVFDYVLERVEVYENQRRDIVDAFKFLTDLGQDALTMWLIMRLSNEDKERLKEDQLNAANWIQSLAGFQSVFLKKNSTAEMRSTLCYLKYRLLNHSVPDLVVFEELLKGMGGVDVGEMSEAQLEALCGGAILKSLDFGLQSSDDMAAKRLSDALLRDPELIPSLLILLAQQRQVIESVARPDDPEILEKYTGEHLKQLIHTYDRAHEAFQHFSDFLAEHVDLKVYYEILPDVETLCEEANVDLEIALLISRRKLQRMLRKHGTPEDLPATVTQIEKCANDKRIWGSFTPRFYLLFWSLTMYDIYTPTKRYEKEIDRIKDKLRSLDDCSRGNTRNNEFADMSSKDRQRERKRLEELWKGLQREKEIQQENQTGLAAAMDEDRNHWLDTQRNSFSIAEDVVQYCLAPRAVLSIADAIFCARFLLKMHAIAVPSFATSQVIEMILTNMNYILGRSEQEARNYGRFMRELLTVLNKWSLSEDSYNAEGLNGNKLPGLQRSSIARNDSDFADKLVPWKGFRALCVKWGKCMASFFAKVLDERQHSFVRLCLIVMTQIIDVFPVIEEQGMQIEKRLLALIKDETREDLKLLARSYLPKLKQRERDWIPKEDFKKGLNARKSEPSSSKRKAEDPEPSGSSRPATRRRVGQPAADDSVFQRLGKKVSPADQSEKINSAEKDEARQDSTKDGKPVRVNTKKDKSQEEGEIDVTPTSSNSTNGKGPNGSQVAPPQEDVDQNGNNDSAGSKISKGPAKDKSEHQATLTSQNRSGSHNASGISSSRSALDRQSRSKSREDHAKSPPSELHMDQATPPMDGVQERLTHPLPERPRDPPIGNRREKDRSKERPIREPREVPMIPGDRLPPRSPREWDLERGRDKEIARERERDHERIRERDTRRDREIDRERDLDAPREHDREERDRARNRDHGRRRGERGDRSDRTINNTAPLLETHNGDVPPAQRERARERTLQFDRRHDSGERMDDRQAMRRMERDRERDWAQPAPAAAPSPRFTPIHAPPHPDRQGRDRREEEMDRLPPPIWDHRERHRDRERERFEREVERERGHDRDRDRGMMQGRREADPVSPRSDRPRGGRPDRFPHPPDGPNTGGQPRGEGPDGPNSTSFLKADEITTQQPRHRGSRKKDRNGGQEKNEEEPRKRQRGGDQEGRREADDNSQRQGNRGERRRRQRQ